MRVLAPLFQLLSFVYLLESCHGLAARGRTTTAADLPTLDVTEPVVAPSGVSSNQFYLPTYTLLRAGPVAFVRRLVDQRGYEQTVYKYMADYKENSLMTAQGNADAYLASPGKKRGG